MTWICDNIYNIEASDSDPHTQTYKRYYRPSALTSCICKTLERIINGLLWYLESNKIITECQEGFGDKRSTVGHLVRLETYMWSIFIKNLVAIFLDLEKVYDSMWKYGVTKDLKERDLILHRIFII